MSLNCLCLIRFNRCSAARIDFPSHIGFGQQQLSLHKGSARLGGDPGRNSQEDYGDGSHLEVG